MKQVLIFVGDRCKDAVETLGIGVSVDEVINEDIASLYDLGYKRFRLKKIISQLESSRDNTVGIALDNLDREEILTLKDQLAEHQDGHMYVGLVAVIWDHQQQTDPNVYANFMGLPDDPAVLQLAQEQSKARDAKMVQNVCQRLFKLSRINDQTYIDNWLINSAKS